MRDYIWGLLMGLSIALVCAVMALTIKVELRTASDELFTCRAALTHELLSR